MVPTFREIMADYLFLSSGIKTRLVPNSIIFKSFISPAMAPALPSSENRNNDRLMSGKKLEFINSTYLADNGEKEKQITVDPISLRASSVREDMIVVPVISAPDVVDYQLPPPPLPPSQFKFLTYSLSNSANSSPRLGLMKKRGKFENQASHLRSSNSTKIKSPAQEEIQIQRSKSCGEGRASAPADDLDLWLNKVSFPEGKFSRVESNKDDHRNSSKNLDHVDDGFKCGALCLFLPGFSRGKTIRSMRKVEEDEPEIGKVRISRTEIGSVISRTVSMEKFECGSWASSAIPNDTGDDEASSNLFFDLPMELMRNSVDANAPVNAAFVFDKDHKGVTKNNSGKLIQKHHESSHHVRFSASTSAPSTPPSPGSCITPRLRKAREEFNAFLEAQNSA